MHLENVLACLGIAQDVKPKLKPTGAGSLVVAPVAKAGLSRYSSSSLNPAPSLQGHFRRSCRAMCIIYLVLAVPPKMQTLPKNS